MSEIFWFFVSFILFVLLGPFSAPVVLIVLGKLGLETYKGGEPTSSSSL